MLEGHLSRVELYPRPAYSLIRARSFLLRYTSPHPHPYLALKTGNTAMDLAYKSGKSHVLEGFAKRTDVTKGTLLVRLVCVITKQLLQSMVIANHL